MKKIAVYFIIGLSVLVSNSVLISMQEEDLNGDFERLSLVDKKKKVLGGTPPSRGVYDDDDSPTVASSGGTTSASSPSTRGSSDGASLFGRGLAWIRRQTSRESTAAAAADGEVTPLVLPDLDNSATRMHRDPYAVDAFEQSFTGGNRDVRLTMRPKLLPLVRGVSYFSPHDPRLAYASQLTHDILTASGSRRLNVGKIFSFVPGFQGVRALAEKMANIVGRRGGYTEAQAAEAQQLQTQISGLKAEWREMMRYCENNNIAYEQVDIPADLESYVDDPTDVKETMASIQRLIGFVDDVLAEGSNVLFIVGESGFSVANAKMMIACWFIAQGCSQDEALTKVACIQEDRELDSFRQSIVSMYFDQQRIGKANKLSRIIRSSR